MMGTKDVMPLGTSEVEVTASIFEFGSETVMVRDDAVMDNSKVFVTAKIRVGVFPRTSSVGCSPCMGNA